MQTTLENIQQRGDSLLVDVTKNGKRHRVTCNDLTSAIAVREKLMRASHAVVKPEGWTLREAYDQVYIHRWKGKANESNSVRHAEEFMAFFNEYTPLDEVTTDWVDKYVAQLKDAGNSAGTINRKLAAGSALFTFAHKRGKCRMKPHFERQTEGEGRTRFLTQTEEQQLLRYLDQWGYDEHSEVVCVLVDTGLRPSELWRLVKRDINLDMGDNGILTVQKSKNNKKRSVPLTLRAKEIITRRMELTASGPLFPFDKNWLERVWARVRRQMGMDSDPEFVPYALRHTCASRLIQRGVKLTVVQEWLGHKNILITRKYAHHAPENLLDAVKVLER